MKKICVVSPSTVPLPIKDSYLSTLEGSQKTSFLETFCHATSHGLRPWHIANVLSRVKGLDVTLFVPDIFFPESEAVDQTKLPFQLQIYNLKAAKGIWSEELDRKFKKFDFVILPTIDLIGTLNGAVLSYDTNLIVDGWNFTPSEEPCNLLGHNRTYKKVIWDRFIQQYVPLLKRANCILYATDSQRFGYEGQFFMIEKQDWKAFQFSTLLKVPYGVDAITPVDRGKVLSSTALNLVWFGEIKPWHYPEVLFSIDSKDLKSTYIHFLHAFTSRNKKSYSTYFYKYFESIESSNNFVVENNYVSDLFNMFTGFDASIVLTKPWIINNYSIHSRILTSLSYGVPVICNVGIQFVKELKTFAKDYIIECTYDDLPTVFTNLRDLKSSLTYDAKQLTFLQKELSWTKVCEPLITYINEV